jgi:hypothetical protein
MRIEQKRDKLERRLPDPQIKSGQLDRDQREVIAGKKF